MDFEPVWEARTLLIDGFLTTIKLSLIAVGLGTVLGLVVATLQTLRIRLLNAVLRVLVEVFRGTPLLMQLFFIYFGIPMLGYNVDRFFAAVVAISLYSGAYVAEVFRAGIESVPGGQLEAAGALGFNRYQRLRHVVAPQGIRVALPALIGVYASVIKDTSLATIIGYNELMRASQDLVLRTGRPIEIFITVGVLYFIICYPLSLASKKFEKSPDPMKIGHLA